ncbi:carbohydrate-binding protein [Streptosporangiaceae bacterium NEAU-GS5]|nr:carbohydrate-binding protein [Streptosporangiaceae bacterium NEAU-GS5]
MSHHTSRRQFLRAAALTAGVAALPVPLMTGRAAAASPWDDVPAILARIMPPTFPDRTFDITAYGAVGNNSADCTTAFKNAIAACSGAGGGTVLVPSGTFRTGQIHLLDNVRLQVNGTIRFRTDHGSYQPNVFTRYEGIECYNFSPFIYANGKSNIAISGTGTIDGNAPAGDWSSFGSSGTDRTNLKNYGANNTPVTQRQFGDGHKLRPNMIGLYNCTNILVEGVTLTNPAMWSLHPVYSTNITVRGVTFRTTNSQGDGVDPDSCTDVHIHDCRFDTNDDCIPIKSGRDQDGRRVNLPCQNIVIENCKFSGRWGGVTIGSEASGGVRNVYAQDCQVNPTDFPGRFPCKYALYVKTSFNRGGFIENVHLRRITGRALERAALYITLNYETSGSLPPRVQNFTLDQITITSGDQAWNLDGRSADHIKNVTISNSTFTNIATAAPTVNFVDNLVLAGVSINGKDVSNSQPPPANRYEAENAVFSQAIFENSHSGFSGTGYVNTDNVAGSYVEFTVNSAGGPQTLKIRYANGTSANRPMAIAVNGATVATRDYNATANWDTWATDTLTVTTNPGANTIRLTGTTANGCPNVDYIEIS